MAIADGFLMLENAMTDTLIFNVSWIISAFIILLVLLLITRDYAKWKILLLPVTVLVHIIGLTPSFIIYVIAGILFVTEILSIQMIGETLGVISEKIAKGTTEIFNTEKRRINKLANKERKTQWESLLKKEIRKNRTGVLKEKVKELKELDIKGEKLTKYLLKKMEDLRTGKKYK